MTKRLLSLLFAIVLMVSFSACSSNESSVSDTNRETASSELSTELSDGQDSSDVSTTLPDTTNSQESSQINEDTTATTDAVKPEPDRNESIYTEKPENTQSIPTTSASTNSPSENKPTSSPVTEKPTENTTTPPLVTSETEETTVSSNDYKIRITVNGQELTAIIYNNATGRDFIDRLPMTLPMLDLYGREMCYRFSDALATDNVQYTGYEVGEIVYWPPRHSFVILYAQNGEQFDMQKIGRIDSGIDIFNGIGNVEITIELIK